MAMDLETLHTDGANFYQYLRGNPFMGSDPLGLEYTAPSVTAATGIGVSVGATQASTYAGATALHATATASIGTAGISGGSLSMLSGLAVGYGAASYSSLGFAAKFALAMGLGGAVAAIAAGGGYHLVSASMGSNGQDDLASLFSATGSGSSISRPRLFTHSKHHPKSSSPEPPDAGDAYNRSISVDGGRTWWSLAASGEVYRYQASNGEAHWNGQTGAGRSLRVPQDAWKALGGTGRPPK
jgi:hypothetical protein